MDPAEEANPSSRAHRRGLQVHAGPRSQVFKTMVQQNGRFTTPIGSYAALRAAESAYLAQRNVIPSTRPMDAGPFATDQWRQQLAKRIKAAILDKNSVPVDKRNQEAYRHLFGDNSKKRKKEPRWDDSELDILCWRLVSYGELAALGQCHVPHHHEAEATPYREYPSLDARVAAAEEILKSKKNVAANCFRENSIAARFMWNPEKEKGTSDMNDIVNENRRIEAARRRTQNHGDQQQAAAGPNPGSPAFPAADGQTLAQGPRQTITPNAQPPQSLYLDPVLGGALQPEGTQNVHPGGAQDLQGFQQQQALVRGIHQQHQNHREFHYGYSHQQYNEGLPGVLHQQRREDLAGGPHRQHQQALGEASHYHAGLGGLERQAYHGGLGNQYHHAGLEDQPRQQTAYQQHSVNEANRALGGVEDEHAMSQNDGDAGDGWMSQFANFDDDNEEDVAPPSKRQRT
ncbi:hypothetical protein F5Y18DRAFT_440925 [Xylariaceae sp. FL1019]|nr:hypothetical protein F5Y18DRAFT_440925 [Xylariaceae sp. FL1019]